jgi:hypothetical protein
VSDVKQQFVCDTHLKTQETLTLKAGSPFQVALHVAFPQHIPIVQAKVSYDTILTTYKHNITLIRAG